MEKTHRDVVLEDVGFFDISHHGLGIGNPQEEVELKKLDLLKHFLLAKEVNKYAEKAKGRYEWSKSLRRNCYAFRIHVPGIEIFPWTSPASSYRNDESSKEFVFWSISWYVESRILNARAWYKAIDRANWLWPLAQGPRQEEFISQQDLFVLLQDE
jgi:hypothetical protein